MRRVLAAVLLLAAVPAAAALFVATSVEEAARSSDAVVRGTVVSARGRVTASGRRVMTDVEIAVASAWKGEPAATVRVVVPGGSTPGLGMSVDGAPTFEEGEEVVVFLGRTGDAWQVIGLAAGKYRVTGADARPGLAPEDVAPRALAAGERAAGPMPVAELERRVRAAR
ncbi:MAG TPA: hypothetical protein VF875_15250 [Anaeromyxobacter sp.]